jgi:protein associated with RNAse G/E
MKCIYRIKITEQNDGEKMYTPQVTRPVGKLLKIFGFKDKWFNIIPQLGNHNGFDIDESMSYSFNVEEKAIEYIEGHKLCMEGKYGKQTKSITYKQV